MTYQELAVLLPCHSLEDFPTHHEGDEAAGLLSSWTCLWHPHLIAGSGGIVKWHRSDDPPESLTDILLVVPTVAEDNLPTGYLQRARDAGARVIIGKPDRAELISEALHGCEVPDLDPDLVADFLSLGYCYLQIQLLTRQMRYASNLDEIHFENLVCEAAKFAVGANASAARDKIQASFDLLSAERDHYYSVDAFLIDVNMVAHSTLGTMLKNELSDSLPSNLLIAPEWLESLFLNNSDTAQRIQQRIGEGTLTVMGCEYGDIPNAVLSAESVLAALIKGQEEYQKYFKSKPVIYGRKQFGLSPNHPQWLSRIGYEAAFHVLLDEGSYPEGQQAKARWEGVDGTSLDAIARVPLNANKHETFLTLASRLSETMDMDHVATLCLAHWPGQCTIWYSDLKRAARYTTALGRFVTLEEYFRETDLPGVSERFEADQYQSPYLRQALAGNVTNPLSRSIQYWRHFNRYATIRSISTLTQLITLKPEVPSCSASVEQTLATNLFNSLDDTNDSSLDEQLESAHQEAVQAFSDGLPRSGEEGEGLLVINSGSRVWRASIQDKQLSSLPHCQDPVYAVSDSHPLGSHVMVDVPAMGFVWAAAQQEMPTTGQEMALGTTLQNDFFQVLINESSGGIQAINSHADPRHGRGSLQLAYRHNVRKKSGRRAEPDDMANYSLMEADSVSVTAATSTYGEITSCGRLTDRGGETLATFEQVFSLNRGSRVLNMDITLDIRHAPANHPWNSYYCLRYAWADEAANLYRGVNGVRQRATGKRLEAPQFIEIESDKTTTLLTNGLPFHRRVGRRFLDTILVVPGEQCRRFQLGIGVDLIHPLVHAHQFGQPPSYVAGTFMSPSGHSTSSLLHLDAKNVMATHWDVLKEDDQVVGYQVRLMETAGRAGRVRLTSFQPAVTAKQCNLDGSHLGDCNVEEGQVLVEMTASEWVQIEVRFQ